MRVFRRCMLALTAGALVVSAAATAAMPYPSRPIRVIVPFRREAARTSSRAK